MNQIARERVETAELIETARRAPSPSRRASRFARLLGWTRSSAAGRRRGSLDADDRRALISASSADK